MTARALSIHIGLNSVDPGHYRGWKGLLNACEADARAMAGLATKRGFVPRLLLTPDATRQNVLGALHEAAGQLRGGDILLLTYSGHGGQIPDTNGDEPDGLDETWCLFDGELIDDELNASLVELAPGVRVLVLSDSCHSGSVTRSLTSRPGVGAPGADSPAVRAMPAAVAFRVYRDSQGFYDELRSRIAPNVVDQVRAHVLLISGCQDDQLSAEGPCHGVFTSNLLRVWNDAAFSGDHPGLHRAIVELMPSGQTPRYSSIGPFSRAFETERPFTP